MDKSCNNSDPSYSGDLEETYTDFEAWITRWNYKFKTRYSKNNPMNKTTDASEPKIALQDLLVYGFITSNRIMAPKDIVLKLSLRQTEDFIHLDHALMKLLNKSDICRKSTTNKSKL